MKSIEGRDSDIISTPGGDFIVVEFFVILFEYMTGVDQFQVTQDALDHLTIKIVKNPQFTDGELHHIRDEIQKRAGNEVRIAIEFVDEIPLSGRSGKRRLVISHVPLKI